MHSGMKQTLQAVICEAKDMRKKRSGFRMTGFVVTMTKTVKRHRIENV